MWTTIVEIVGIAFAGSLLVPLSLFALSKCGLFYKWPTI